MQCIYIDTIIDNLLRRIYWALLHKDGSVIGYE